MHSEQTQVASSVLVLGEDLMMSPPALQSNLPVKTELLQHSNPL
jgi:hypothetical protein